MCLRFDRLIPWLINASGIRGRSLTEGGPTPRQFDINGRARLDQARFAIRLEVITGDWIKSRAQPKDDQPGPSEMF